MRAAVYLRQSKDRYGDELAVSRQRDDCLALCAQRGWMAVEYLDNDRSASNGKPRPDYQRMLADIRANEVQAVVAWDADRLHRRPVELEEFIDLADTKRLSLATIGGDFDLSTPTGRGNARMKGVFARMEMEQKSARQKRAAKQLAEEDGRGWWPSRPFGYDADPDRITGRWWMVRRDPATKAVTYNTILLHRTEARLVREAYSDFLAGSSLRSIAARWNEAGVRTPKGNPWTGTQVRQLLLSERNAGLREYRGEVVGGARWPAIVTEDVWRMAVAKLTDAKRRSGATRGRKYLLSNIATCGLCGSGLGSAISSRGQRQYHCNHCQKLSRDGVKLDALITEAVVRRLSRPDAVDLLRPPVDEVDTEALREERRALKDRLEQLGKDFASAPPEFTQAALSDIAGKLGDIDAVLLDPGKARVFEGIIGADDVRAAFESLDLGRQRTIMETLMVVTVLPVGKGTGRVFNPDYINVVWR